MNYRHATLSVLYSLSQITLGLLLHPYQTMQSLVRDKVFIWMSLLPTLVLAVTTIVWRFGVVPFVQFFVSCSEIGLGHCDFLALFSDWLSFFCVYWQLLLLYWLFRFSSAWRKTV